MIKIKGITKPTAQLKDATNTIEEEIMPSYSHTRRKVQEWKTHWGNGKQCTPEKLPPQSGLVTHVEFFQDGKTTMVINLPEQPRTMTEWHSWQSAMRENKPMKRNKLNFINAEKLTLIQRVWWGGICEDIQHSNNLVLNKETDDSSSEKEHMKI